MSIKGFKQNSFHNRFTRAHGGDSTGIDASPPPPVQISATGGNQSPGAGLEPGNGYRYHTFTSSGSLVVTEVGPGTAEIFLVAGGGSGSGSSGYDSYGGGGAGGLVVDTAFPLKSGTYTITVGGGGADSTISHPEPQLITALAGGDSDTSGSGSGGSGGGRSVPGHGTPTNLPAGGPATQPGQSQTGGSGSLEQFGSAGTGAESPGRYAAGGGGGAGAAGTLNSPSHSGGNDGGGGDGRQYPAFTGPLIGVPALAPHNGYYAGGGAGYDNSPALGSDGGLGGGAPSTSATTAGTQYTGGGGARNGAGGSGIVVIRYAV